MSRSASAALSRDEKLALLARRLAMRTGGADERPLSSAQARLWLLEQLMPGTPLYNIPSRLRLTGPLDPDALERSLAAFVQRHEVLRTTYAVGDDGQPRARVAPPEPLHMRRVDLRELGAGAREASLARLTREEALRPIELGHAPLLRALLVALADDDHVLLLTLHHIAIDGRSLLTLVRELGELYPALARGEAVTLPPPVRQYAEAVRLQARRLEGAPLDALLEFWTHELQGAPAGVALPYDRPRAGGRGQHFAGGRLRAHVEPQVSARLRALADEQGATLFMVGLAAFQVLLQRYGGQDDVLIGTPVLGRTLVETEDVPGLFANTLVLRGRPRAGLSFRALVAQTRATVMRALSHQELPFEKLVEVLRPARAAGRNPLFDVMFALQYEAFPTRLGEHLRLEFLDPDPGTAKFDLNLTLKDSQGRLTSSLEYSSELFAEATAQRLLDHYHALLAAVVERPGARVCELALGDGQPVWLRGEPGPPAGGVEHDLVRALAQRAAALPAAPAVIDGARVVSARSLRAWAAGLAGQLRRLGAGPGTRVALLDERAPATLAAALGVLEAGAAFVRLDPTWSDERLRAVLRDAGVTCVVCAPAGRARAAAWGVASADLEMEPPQADVAPVMPPAWEPEAPACVAYEAGAEGDATGVIVTRRALACACAAHARGFALGPSDRLLVLGARALAAAPAEVCAAWLGSAAVVLPPEPCPAPGAGLHAFIDHAGVTVVHLPVESWDAWVAALDEAAAERFPRALRLVVVDGEAVCSERWERWRERVPASVTLSVCYRPARWPLAVLAGETGPDTHAAPDWPLPLGRALDGVSACVLDAELRPLPHGAVGELFLGGMGLPAGLHGAAARTAERLVPDPFAAEPGARLQRTGARVRLDARGRLHLLGRAARSPEGLDPQTGSSPATGATRAAQPGAPASALEEALASLWCTLLGRGAVRPDDDFFALGGHSLLAMRLVVRVREAFGVELPLEVIFERSTLRGLAQAIAAARGASTGLDRPIERVPRDGPLPLSSAQARLWFLEQLVPGEPVYAMPLVLRLLGRLDPEVLPRVLDELVRRHEVLRTRIAALDGQPLQHIEAPCPWPLEHVALDGLDPEAFRAAAEARARAELTRPFDLERVPCARAALLRRDAQDHALVLVLHHISVDGWGMTRLFEELASLYDAFAAGRPSPLPEPALDYADCVAWQERRLAQGELDGELAYWRRQLADVPASLPLPCARGHAEPGSSSSAGGQRLFRLPAALAARVRALARAQSATPFMVLLAAFEALLQRVCGQREFTLGVPVAGRVRPELERVVGLFANTVVVRAHVGPGLSLRALLSAARRTVLEAFAHQELPFERVVEALRPQRTAAENPLFRVMFALQNLPRPPRRVGELELQVQGVDTGAAKFDLSLTLIEEAGAGLLGSFEYRSAVVSPDDARHLASAYAVLLEAALAQPDAPIDELPLLDGEGRARLVAGARGEPRELPVAPLHAHIEAQARAHPRHCAVTGASASLSYAELDERASRLATRLRALGAGTDVCVGVCAERSPAAFIALLAVMKAGGAFAVLDPLQPRRRLERACAQVGPRLILADQLGRERLPGTNRPLVALEAAETWADPPLRRSLEPHPDALAYVVCTSGTTGEPRAVAVPQRALLNHALEARERFELTPDDRVAQFAAPAFDVALEELFPTWLAGATLVLRPADPPEPGEAFTRWLDEAAVSVVNLPASYWQAWVAALSAPGARALPQRLRLVVVGSEPVTRDAVRAWARVTRVRLLNAYGTSETAVTSTSHAFDAPLDAAPPPIGRPWANVCALVLDERGEPLPPGVAGELHLGGAGLARGYLGRPDLTAERFVPDPFGAPGARLYRTGDRVRRLTGGALQFVGRVDHQLKLRGLRLEPDEVAAALVEHPRVRAAVVTARGSGEALRLVAYHVSEPDPPAADALRAFLRERLPAAFIPQAFVALPAFPLTSAGKIDRAALPEPDPDPGESAGGAPSTTSELRLARLWSELLRLPRVGVGDDFFALGGHSLLALRLSARIEQEFGVHVALRALFEQPTLAAQARIVESLAQTDASTGAGTAAVGVLADPAARFEPFPLTELQEAYWLGRSAAFELGNVGAHGYQEVDCEGLDLPRYEAAWRGLIARHDMLRAVVRPDGRQQVLEHVPPFTVDVQDLRGLSDEEAERRVLATRAAMSHQLLPADRWPLYQVRASLLPGRTRLHISCDALIADDLSWRTLERELLELYREPARALPPLELTFRDYVLAEERLRGGEAHRRAEEYWRARAEHMPPPPELPLARPLSSLARPTFRRLRRRLAREAVVALEGHATRAGCTLSALLLAAFGEALAVYSRAPHFCIALTRFHRLPLHPQVERILGDFTRVALLELDLREPLAFHERLRAVQARLWDDLEHGSAGGVALLRELSRRHGVPPVVPVVFTSTLGQPGLEGLGALPQFGRPVYAISQTPQVLLDHQVFTHEGGLVCNWDAVAAAFPEGLLDGMAEAYFGLLERLAREPSAWDAPVTELVPASQVAVRARTNATAGPCPETTLHGLFLAQLEARRDAPAIVAPARTLTYGELDAHSAGWAARLSGQGLQPGERVAVVMDKGWEQPVAALGVLRAGGAYVPLDPSLPRPRLDSLLKQTQARFALTQPRWRAALAWPDGVQVLPVEAEVPAPAMPAPPQVAPDALAYVIYTSGSTGTPKGVMISHRGAVNTIVDLNRRLDVGPDDRVLSLSSFGFDLSVYDLFGLLAAGGAMVLPEAGAEADPAHWAARLREGRVTLWNSVPALMELLVEHAGERVDEQAPLRWLLLSGDRIGLSLPERARRVFPRARVLSLGGATEASIWSIAFPCDERDPAWPAWPYGRPLTNQSLHVLDGRLEPRPDWVAGELYIGGIGLALGYLGDEAQTRARFLVHPRTGERLYRTGDAGCAWPDGTLQILGRLDDQVKVRGFRIELGEIETVLQQHPGVRAAAAAVSEDGGERRLVAGVVCHGEAPDVADLREFLRARLPAYMLPASITLLERLPLSPNGKLDRRALAARAPRPDPAAQATHAEDPDVARVAELVARVLRLRSITPTANLFELGATSVDFIRLLNAMETELGFRPRIAELYAEPTPSALAALWRRAQPATPPAAPAGDFAFIEDEAERAAFRRALHGVRHEDASERRARVSLPELERPGLERRTRREFSMRPIPLELLARLLACQRRWDDDGEPRHLYGSAGGLYPVQLHLHVKPGRVAGLGAGVYYYHPLEHALVALAPGAELGADIHEPFWNRPIFERAAFSLFCILRRGAIEPLYGADGVRFATLETGALCQVLEEHAARLGLGLCQIGAVAFERVRALFRLRPDDQLLHSLVGGLLPGAEGFEEGEL